MKEHEENGELEEGEAILCRTCWKTCFSKAQYEDHAKTHGDDAAAPTKKKKKEAVYDELDDNDDDNSLDSKTDHNKPFECEVCHKTYSTSVKLHYHKRTHRPKKFEVSVCEHCNESFPTKKHLIAHRSKFHKVKECFHSVFCIYSIYNIHT